MVEAKCWTTAAGYGQKRAEIRAGCGVELLDRVCTPVADVGDITRKTDLAN